MNTLRVAVVGARGRMGATVVEAVSAAPDMEVVARIDVDDQIATDTLNQATVAVDFTAPAVTEDNVHALLDCGVNVVVGTTGWTDESRGRVAEHAERAGRSVIIAPNFAMSAILAMKFAEMAAPYFESARTTAERIARARREAGCAPMPDATRTDPEGTRGGVIDGVPVHAVRLRGLVAHEEILLGNEGEQLVIRTDSFDRASFMPGVLFAIRHVHEQPGLTVGVDQLMTL